MSNTDGAAPAAAGGGELSIAQAVNILSEPPKTKPDEPAPAPDRDRGTPPERPDAPPEEAPPDGDDAEPEEAPGEDEAVDEAEEPPVKPPRTWTKAEKEAFALLPREHQQSIVDRESERDSYYQRGLKEAAEKSKAAQAREQAAEQARVQYEQALPELYAKMHGDFQSKFGDIKSQADVDAMRVNDPMRWMEYRDAKEVIWNTYNQNVAAQQRQEQEQAQRYQAYQSAESVKVEAYLAKEHAKLGSAKEIGDKVRSVMIDHYGYADNELSAYWWQGQPMYLADSRTQQMAIDAYAWRDLQAKKAAAPESRKPVPPVQRPGTATNRGESQNVSLKILSDRLSKTGRLEDAVALQNAKSALARRRG